MSASNVVNSAARPSAARRLLAATIVAALLFVASLLCLVDSVHPVWLAYAFAAFAALLAGSSYALSIRHVPGRLPLFGKGRVLVRSLDDWTMYQYNVPFDKASAEQQSHALDHYKVGDRLFPARPQDRVPGRTFVQAAASLVTFCSIILLSEALRGWNRLYLFIAFYAYIWLCMRWSKRFSESAAPTALTGIGLS